MGVPVIVSPSLAPVIPVVSGNGFGGFSSYMHISLGVSIIFLLIFVVISMVAITFDFSDRTEDIMFKCGMLSALLCLCVLVFPLLIMIFSDLLGL